MPKYDAFNDEAASPRTKQAMEETVENIENSNNDEKIYKEKFYENMKETELLSDTFMKFWYNQDTKHPGILYHLPRSEAFEGFELYHYNNQRFILWREARLKKKVIAPYPITPRIKSMDRYSMLLYTV
jgi:hypothetical protein